MSIGLYLGPYLFNDAIRPDQEGHAMSPHKVPSHEGFRAPDAIGRDKRLVFIRHQGKREAVFAGKAVMGGQGIDTDAQNDGILLLEGLELVTKATSFPGTARRGIPGIEIEHDGFTLQILEGNMPPMTGGSIKEWRRIAGFERGCERFGHRYNILSREGGVCGHLDRGCSTPYTWTIKMQMPQFRTCHSRCPAYQSQMLEMPRFIGRVEFSEAFAPRAGISHVLFDFDGTLSLIRQGWPEVMLPMFLEMLPRVAGDTEESVRTLLYEDIMRLNGKQTIYQMIQFADRVSERGGAPREPLWYKHEYLRRLDERIEHRVKGLEEGRIKPDDVLVHGTRHLLELLQARGLPMYLASGTDVAYVQREANLLDISRYFGRHIYGALDDFKNFSKKMVIDRILAENKIEGARLLSFGDGYVEILNTKEVGGLAVAVASDEAHNGSGNMDEWKRQRLMGVGADVVIPDYRDIEALLGLILG